MKIRPYLLSKRNWLFIGLVILSVFLQLGFKISLYKMFGDLRRTPDSYSYYIVYKYMLDGADTSLTHQGLTGSEWRKLRSPGFPLLLRGISISRDKNLTIKQVGQRLKKLHFVLGLLISLIVFALVYVVWGNRWFALFSSWLYPFSQTVWQYESAFLSETSAIFLLLCSFTCLIYGLKCRKIYVLLIAGVLWTLLVSVREEFSLYPIVAAIAHVVIQLYRKRKKLEYYKPIIFFAAAYVASLSFVFLYNGLTTGHCRPKGLGFVLNTRMAQYIPKVEPHNETERKFIDIYSTPNLRHWRIWAINRTLKRNGFDFETIEKMALDLSIRAMRQNIGQVCGDLRLSIYRYFSDYKPRIYMPRELNKNLGNSFYQLIFWSEKQTSWTPLLLPLFVIMSCFALCQADTFNMKLTAIVFFILLQGYRVLSVQVTTSEYSRRFDVVRLLFFLLIFMTFAEVINTYRLKRSESLGAEKRTKEK